MSTNNTQRLSEAALDAQIADKRVPPLPMWSEERESPRLFALVYAITFVCVLLMSHFCARV